MQYTTLNFTLGQINASIQVGDYVYYSSSPSTSGGFSITDDENGHSTLVYFGEVAALSENIEELKFAIVVEHENDANTPSVGNFILFAKNDNANTSSMSGYYSSFTFKNDSKTKAELFATTCNVTESSK